MIYVGIIIFMCNPYLLKDDILVSQFFFVISGEINVKMCIIEKNQKTIAKKI